MDSRWSATQKWVGDDLSREAFFFPAAEERAYGSIYAATSRSHPFGLVICNSWGFEGNQSDRTMHLMALAAARAGGISLIFHYPGFGDSPGRLVESSMSTLVNATVGAVGEGSRRYPSTRWVLAGLMFGASVACLAAGRTAADRLLLVQPSLEPSRYFRRLERSARRAAIRVPARTGNAYGYPLPHRILAAGSTLDAEVTEALSGFDGEGAIVRYAKPPAPESIPAQFDEVIVPGVWRFGARQSPHLARHASKWLEQAIPHADAAA